MTATLRSLCPLLALLLSCGAAMGQSRADECIGIGDAASRLACYDRVHGRMDSPPAAAPAAPAAPASAAVVTAASSSRIESHLGVRWDLEGQRGTLFSPRPYRPVYLLPATWTDKVNRRPSSPAPEHSVPSDLVLKAVEAKYQLSLKAKFAHELLGMPVSLWGGYTQSSRWQVYNGADSRPFRETNYEPELMLVWPLDANVLGWRLKMASLSLNHQSNGRALPLSRSWNRYIGMLALERDDWVAELRPWVRVGENAADDDNPDIEDYVGRGELRLSRYYGEHALSLQLRHSLRPAERSRGSAQLDWVFPLAGALHGYLQLINGYGESLVDYNLRQTKAGLGVTITGWR